MRWIVVGVKARLDSILTVVGAARRVSVIRKLQEGEKKNSLREAQNSADREQIARNEDTVCVQSDIATRGHDHVSANGSR
jgi:hypothetical protein